jgi:2-keto-4-pentenoate hydratase
VVESVDPRLTSALLTQLERRDAALARGARRVGWKLGMGDAERNGSGPAVGYLTSATQLEPGGEFRRGDEPALHADVEIAVQFADDADPDGDVGDAIGGYAAALELVDLGSRADPAEAIVATNIFHRAFALGQPARALPADAVMGRLVVDGTVRGSATAPDLTDRLQRAARVLATVGERLRAGDYVITGSIVQERVAAGEELTAELGPLGSVTLRVVR